MLLEMHCHAAEHSACSHVDAASLIKQIFRKGLEGVVITDHHYLWPQAELKQLRKKAEVPDYFVILSGQEVSTADAGDVLVYGATEMIPKGTSLAAIRKQFPQAALVLAHPYRKGKKPGKETLLNPLLDGIEIFSSNHSVAENAQGLRDWHRLRFIAIAGTDTHAGSYAGSYPTLFDHPIETIEELVGELKKGRCRPFFKEIPKAGATIRVDEITIGTKGEDETRERIVIRQFQDAEKWHAAERAFHIMEEIVRHGFDKGRYRVPRLIEQDQENMVLIEEGLRGNSLFEKLIRSSMEDAKYFIQLSAQWLASLHSLRLQITPPEEFLEKEPQRLAHYLGHFEDINHPHTERAREIKETIAKAETALFGKHPEKLVQGHGDFHPKNIYIGQDKAHKRETLYVAAIDFNSSYCLPPAFDVGTFLAQFHNQLFPYPEILEAMPEDLFLDAYRAAAADKDGAFLRQVELFRARTDLSIASFLIKLGLGESEGLWRVLVEAEEALTQFECMK
jgi:aminoglycoside phosphotransferase (APT) family kinase protein